MAKVFKTCLFKIHNPSKRKRAMMMDALWRTDRAFWKFMAFYEKRGKALISLERKERRAELSAIKAEVESKLFHLPLSDSATNGLSFDIPAQILSYVELILSGQEANWPLQPPMEGGFEEGLEALVKSRTEEEENAARDLMATKARRDNPRPLSIYRNDKRGTILFQDDKQRLFAWVNLQRATSRFAKPVDVRELVNVRTGEVMSFRSKLGVLLPLECSQWHFERFIKAGQMQSSKLIHRNNEFYLAGTFEYEVNPVATLTYLGVDRGIDVLAAWAVIDESLKVLESGETGGDSLRDYQRAKEKKAASTQRRKGESRISWRAYADQVVHIAANQIVEAALVHASQVVLEDLSAISQGPQHKRPKFQRRSNFARVLNRAQYQKLANVLEYKLPAVGLPPPETVQAAGTSITCNVCGFRDKDNRKTQADFACLACGHAENADAHAAKNIATKYLYWKEVGPKVKGKKLTEDTRYEGWLKKQRENG